MTIAFVHSNNDEIGGSDLAMWNLVRAVRDDGGFPLVVLSKANGMEERYRSEGIPLILTPMPRLRRGSNPWVHGKWLIQVAVASLRLAIFFHREKVALVFANDINELPALIAARWCSVPSVMVLRLIWKGKGILRRFYMRLVAALAGRVVGVSTCVIESNFDGLPESARRKTTVLYDWNEKEKRSGVADERWPESCPVPAGVPVILMLGRKEPWKGQHVLVEAIPSILEKVPDAVVVFAGAPVHGRGREDYETQLRARVSILGLENHVWFLGHQQFPEALLKQAAVAVHCSVDPEPFGLTVLEALSHGTPMVASRAGGPLEIAGDPPACLFHEPGNSSDLGKQILQILTCPETKLALREKALARAAIFSREERWPKWKQLLEEMR